MRGSPLLLLCLCACCTCPPAQGSEPDDVRDVPTIPGLPPPPLPADDNQPPRMYVTRTFRMVPYADPVCTFTGFNLALRATVRRRTMLKLNLLTKVAHTPAARVPCWLGIRAGSDDLMLSVLLVAGGMEGNGSVRLKNKYYTEHWMSYTRWIMPGATYMTSDKLWVSADVSPSSPAFKATVYVTAYSKTRTYGLERHYVTAKLGYIQTQRFSKTNFPKTTYERNMDSWSVLHVPEDHGVMLSVPAVLLGRQLPLHVCDDRLEVYTPGHGPLPMWTICSRFNALPWPVILNVGSVTCRFKSGFRGILSLDGDGGYFGVGLRLLFSFHQDPYLPEALANNTWNCTVPHWAHFKHHLLCNLVTQCASGEDERDCPYRLCGDHSIVIADRCYSLHKSVTAITWHQANGNCTAMGGRLATVKTWRERRHLRHTFRLDLLTKAGYIIIVGFHKTASDILSYSGTFQWSDGTVVQYLEDVSPHRGIFSTFFIYGVIKENNAGAVNMYGYTDVALRDICLMYMCYYLCERALEEDAGARDAAVIPVVLPQPSVRTPPFSHVLCTPGNHTTHSFLAADADSGCGGAEPDVGQSDGDCRQDGTLSSSVFCRHNLTAFPASFACESGVQRVPYSLVCDLRADCHDLSDETFCRFPPCDLALQVECENKQCISKNSLCNKVPDCIDHSDEEICDFQGIKYFDREPPPYLINFDGKNLKYTRIIMTTYKMYFEKSYCPETHYVCPSDGNCLPVHTRCNGVHDCSEREDEAACDGSYTCPGLYRCRGSMVCVHVRDLCDDLGFAHCPQHDDELFCDVSCPQGCTCYGLAFTCREMFSPGSESRLRYLEAPGSGLTLGDVASLSLLVHLGLARCSLLTVDNVSLPNLRSLDLGDNLLHEVSTQHFTSFPSLRRLALGGNPVSSLFTGSSVSGAGLLHLDLSAVVVRELEVDVFVSFVHLESLNLSGAGIDSLWKRPGKVSVLNSLRVLDLRGSPVTDFPKDLLQNMSDLLAVYTDNYKLCCPAMLPAGFNPTQCRAPFDEVSSCDALLRSNVYRVSLAVLASLTLCGNLLSFLARLLVSRASSKSGFGVFVLHLCVSDFVMGVYLAIIGVADRQYLGRYLWEDVAWKRSVTCRLAGMMSLMSCEVSALVICLITLDRFLVLRFPFSSLRFKPLSAQCACAACWTAGLVLTAVPLLPVTSHWRFYSQVGICIPLPVTRADFSGRHYALGVMIIANLVLFVVIACGQVCVYVSIQASRMSGTHTATTSRDARVARRLLTVVMSDFLCWFPIGLLGLLAERGVAIPGEVNVAMAIFVLPLNSALNPFLYTLNMIQERLERRREEHLLNKILASQVNTA